MDQHQGQAEAVHRQVGGQVQRQAQAEEEEQLDAGACSGGEGGGGSQLLASSASSYRQAAVHAAGRRCAGGAPARRQRGNPWPGLVACHAASTDSSRIGVVVLRCRQACVLQPDGP